MRRFLFVLSVLFSLATTLTPALADDAARPDWLLNPSPYVSEIRFDEDAKELTLANGLVERRILLAPNAATASLRNLATGEEMVRALAPEARVTIDGNSYPVGGLTGAPVANYWKEEWKKTSRPLDGADDEKELVKLNIMKILNDKYGITEDDFLSAELCLVPSFKSKDVGFDSSMIGGYGHDDKVCAYPALMAAINADIPEDTCVTYLTDKEEIGSDGNTGMRSDFLRYFIYDLAKQNGIEGYRALSKSTCLSADVNAAFDPTYASAYEAKNSCYINNGVVISKYTGHGGKYDTSDASAEYMGKVRALLENNGIIWQVGELGRVDLGGGGTIAKYVANMNVDVIDLGVPVLSMHAPFEIVAKTDVYMAYRAFYEYFNA